MLSALPNIMNPTTYCYWCGSLVLSETKLVWMILSGRATLFTRLHVPKATAMDLITNVLCWCKAILWIVIRLLREWRAVHMSVHLAAYAKNWDLIQEFFMDHNVNRHAKCFRSRPTNRGSAYRMDIYNCYIWPTSPKVIGDETCRRITNKYIPNMKKQKLWQSRKQWSSLSEGFPVVIVNPTRVYGPGKLTEGNSVSLMIWSIRSRVKSNLLTRHHIGNYVLVDDLVRGIFWAMEKGRIGERYSSAERMLF